MHVSGPEICSAEEEKDYDKALVIYMVVCNRFKDDMDEAGREQISYAYFRAGSALHGTGTALVSFSTITGTIRNQSSSFMLWKTFWTSSSSLCCIMP